MHKAEKEAERAYLARQKSVQKDVERLLGVLHLLFEILSREIRMWYIDEIFRVSDFCVIVYNIIRRMQQNGNFDEDADRTDLVTEMYDMEQEAAQKSRTELKDNMVTIESQTMYDVEDETEWIMLSNMEYMDPVKILKLRDDLVQLSNFESGQ